MGMSSAVKMQRFRQRLKFDQMVLTVTLDRVQLTDVLIEAGFLHRAADDDRELIEPALEKFIETVLKEKLQ